MSWPAALDPAGVQAARIAQLWWWIFWTSVVVWVVVSALALMPVLQRRRRDEELVQRVSPLTPLL